MHRFPLLSLALCVFVGLGGAAVAANPALDEAQRYWDGGEVSSAVIVLKARLAEAPSDSEARMLLARIYLDLFLGAAAEKELTRAQADGVPRADILVPLTRALLLQQRFKQVLDTVSPMLVSGPRRQAAIMALRGHAYRGLGDRARAAAEYQRALETDPGQVDALLGQARVALAERDAQRALSLVQQATEADPSAQEAWELLAELSHALGDRAQAEAALDRAEILARNKLMPRFRRALMYLDRGEIEAALPEIDEVERQFPGFPGLHYARGLLLIRQGLIERGIDSLNEFLRYDATNLQANLLLALAELERGNRDLGEDLLRRYLDAVPGSVRAGLSLAQSQFARRDYIASRETLDEVAAYHPDDARVQAALAQALIGLEQHEQARQAIERAITLQPDSAEYHLISAESLLLLGRTDAALAALDRSVALDPLNRIAPLLRVRVRLKQGQWQEALTFAEELVAQRPTDGYGWNALALARLGGGDESGARDALERALEVSPGFPDAAMNLARLALRDGDMAGARRLMEGIVASDPGHVEATLALAELDGASDQQGQQMARLNDAVDAFPEKLPFRLALARALLQAGRPGQSLAVLQAATDAQKRHPELLLLQGESQVELGALDDALTTYQALLLEAPDNAATAHFLMTRVYAGQDNAAAMAESLVRGIELEPGNPLSVPAIDLALEKLRRETDQMALLDRLLRASDNDPRLIARKADYLVEHGRADSAVALMEDLQVRYPDDVGVMRKLFAMQRAAGDREGYTRTLERWLEAAPQDEAAQLILAQVYAEQEREQEAITLLEALIERRPGNPMALNNLAWLLRQDDPERALTYAERAHRLQPEDAATMNTLGLLLVETGNTERGLRLLDDARIAEPGDHTIAYHYAAALVRAGRGDEARVILLELAQKPFPEQAQARALLAGLDR